MLVSINFLPAKAGDCILLEFDNKKCILIDCGFKSTYYDELKPKLRDLSSRGLIIDLMIITHIDQDHIEGAIELLSDNGYSSKPNVIPIMNIWFNGFKSLILNKMNIGNPSIHQITKMRKIKSLINMQIPSIENNIAAGQAKSFELLCSKFEYSLNAQFEDGIVKMTPQRIDLDGICIEIISPDEELLEQLTEDFTRKLIKLFGDSYQLESNDEFMDFYEKLMLADLEANFNREENISGLSSGLPSWIGTSKLAKMSLSNQSSIVFQIYYKNVAMLFMADSDSELWVDRLSPHYDCYKGIASWIIKAKLIYAW